ncbi:hypothetical protein GCM10027160_07430 [Streptomyces calidiresistens]
MGWFLSGLSGAGPGRRAGAAGRARGVAQGGRGPRRRSCRGPPSGARGGAGEGAGDGAGKGGVAEGGGRESAPHFHRPPALAAMASATTMEMPKMTTTVVFTRPP